MFIFLYGSDIYRSRQKLNEIINHYQETNKKGLNLKYFEKENLNFQNFIDEIQQVSIFKEKKLLILKNVFCNKEFKESFLKEAKKLASLDNIILFYEEKEVLEKDPLFVFLKREAKSQEFKLLDRQRLESWIKKEFFIYEAKIDQGAVHLLIDFIGNNLWQLSNEIKKLASYKKGKKIEMGDVELLVRPKIETDIFKTIEAIAVNPVRKDKFSNGAKNKKQAINLLHKHLEKGDNSLY